MTIDIDKQAILTAVKMAISVIARDEYDTSGNSLYAVIAPTSRDGGMLSQIVGDGIINLISSVKRLNPCISDDGIVLDVRDWSDTKIDSMKSIAHNYLKDNTIGAWLKLKGSEMFQLFIDSASMLLGDFKTMAFTREMPVYSYKPLHDLTVGAINEGDTEVAVSVKLTYGGKEESVSLFTARYNGELTLYAYQNGNGMSVSYADGKVTGFKAKKKDKFMFVLKKRSSVICQTEVEV